MPNVDLSPERPAIPKSLVGFADVAELHGADGIVAVISQRRKSGELTFGIFRRFGENRTTFIPEAMAEEFLKMYQSVLKRMVELKASGKLPFPVRTR